MVRHSPRVVPFTPVSEVRTRSAEPVGLAVILLVLALVSSWIATIIPVESSITTANPAGGFALLPVKTTIYYASHGLAIGCVMAAGLLAVFAGKFKAVGRAAQFAFVILFLTATAWAIKAYSTEEVFSAGVFGATGPFVWLTLLVVVAGADRHVWYHVDRTIQVLAYLTSALALRTLLSGYVYFRGFSRYILYASLLMWLGGWVLLTATRMRGWRLAIRAVPAAVMAIMAICAQSRSWTLLALLLAGAFILLRARERGSVFAGIRTLAIACVLGATAFALVYAVSPRTLTRSATGLARRLDQDTRTGQYRAFFSVVPVEDLLFGRGPKGTWYWNGFGQYQYFDNGYLWMLFIGGVPTLLCYIAIVIWPAVRVFSHHPRGDAAAAACLILLWALALTGLSTFTLPSVGIVNYLISLWAGRCYLALREKRRAAFRAAPQGFSGFSPACRPAYVANTRRRG